MHLISLESRSRHHLQEDLLRGGPWECTSHSKGPSLLLWFRYRWNERLDLPSQFLCLSISNQCLDPQALPSTPALPQHLKTQPPVRGRGRAPFPAPGEHFTLFVACISESVVQECVRVEGGNNCAINDCYFDYRMQLSLRLEANQRVVSGSPLVLSNGPWLKRKLLAIFEQQERKQRGWRWGKCQTLTPDGSQLIFTVVYSCSLLVFS